MTKDNLIELMLEQKTEQYSFEEAQNELNVAISQRDLNKALSISKQIVEQMPSALTIQHQYFQLLLRAQQYEELKNAALANIERHPDDAQSYYALANGYRFSYQPKFAKQAMKKACELLPTNISWLNMLGIMYKEDGENSYALDCFQQCIDNSPDFIEAYWQRSALSPRLTESELNHLKQVTLSQSSANSQQKTNIVYAGYTLFKHFENKTNYAESFKYLTLAAKTQRLSVNYNHQNEIEEHKKIAQVFNEEFLAQIQSEFVGVQSRPTRLPSSDSPIFICGLPRSGTTLAEQIISSHSDVVGGDELFELAKATQTVLQHTKPKEAFPFWADELKPHDWRQIGNEYLSLTQPINTRKRFTDKMLLNYKAIGLMQLALPEAKIVYCERPAMDLLIGCYKQILGQGNMYTYDLDEMSDMIIAQYHLMNHWRALFPNKIFTLNYLQLINDQEKTTRALLEFLELDWQEDCLNFHSNERTIHTISSEQVRQPINRNSIGSWQNYFDELEPYANKLKNAGLTL